MVIWGRARVGAWLVNRLSYLQTDDMLSSLNTHPLHSAMIRYVA